MTARVLLDTNVLVYAAVGTGKDERKRQRSLARIESEDFGTSAQVLQEFLVTMVKKGTLPLSGQQALDWIEQLFRASRLTTAACASRLSRRLATGSYCDAAVLSAARWELTPFTPRI
jgi:predicted nucleic acid-binding protein